VLGEGEEALGPSHEADHATVGVRAQPRGDVLAAAVPSVSVLEA